MTRAAASFLLVLSLAACSPTSPVAVSSGPQTTEPTAEPTADPATHAAATVAPSSVLEPTPEPVASVGLEPCPTSNALTPMTFWNAPTRCFGTDNVRILGWLDTPPPFGFEAPEVRPNWLYYPPDDVFYFTLFEGVPSDAGHVCGDCPGIFVHLRPDSDIVLKGPARWVIATGHRNDAAAERCHYVSRSDTVGELPGDASAREACRLNFVLVALDDAPSP